MSKYIHRLKLGMTFGAILLLLAFWGSIKSQFLYLSLSDSLAYGLYISIPSDNIKVGDYVAYEVPPNVKQCIDEHEWGLPVVFIKKVGATEGMEYYIDGHGRFFADNRYLGTVLKKDSAGHEMPSLKGVHVVPKGEFLPVGTHGLSFDGRYTGTVPVSAIKSRVLPFITY